MALATQTGLSNKFVSERHHYASQTKYTAGEAAKELSKMLKCKILAKQIVEGYKLINMRQPEWHHSGFYKVGNRSTMGRTFFFTYNEIEHLASNWHKLPNLQETENIRLANALQQQEIDKQTIVYGFYYTWEGNRTRYQRKYKSLAWYTGTKINAPKNFTETTKEVYEANKHISRSYHGWDEPKISEFC